MPPKDFDPVEAAALQPEAIDAAVAEALAAFAAAPRPRRTDRGAAGSRRRPVGAGTRQPRDRPAAARRAQGGRPTGGHRTRAGASGACRPHRRARGRARRPRARRRGGGRHSAHRAARARRAPPAHHDHGAARGHLHRDGLLDRRGPRGGRRVAELRRAEHPARPPVARPERHVLGRVDRLRPRPAHADLARCRSARCCAANRRSTSSARARCSAPTNWTPRTRRCSTRSRDWSSTRASRWPT